MVQQQPLWQIFADTGGTFTDCLAVSPQGKEIKVKVLSSSALRGSIAKIVTPRLVEIKHNWGQLTAAMLRGYWFRLLLANEQPVRVVAFQPRLSRLLLSDSIKAIAGQGFELFSGEEAPVLAARLATKTPLNLPLPPLIMRLGTTKGTNALLEARGAPVALFVTRGFADLPEIGNQQRPHLFQLHIQKPQPLHQCVFEVPERLDANGTVIEPIDCSPLTQQVQKVLAQGITNAAVALLHSYCNPIHEQKLAQFLLNQGFTHVSLSSELAPLIKIVPRMHTAIVNATLAPVIEQYLTAVHRQLSSQSRLYIITGAGALVQHRFFTPKDSLLSGPAGGVNGAANTGLLAGYNRIISFDMGGTSTDVARYDNQFDYVYEHHVANAHLLSAALAIETVAAGGGSVCRFNGYRLSTGPESAGANPGPACYGAGGPFTITDVNLLLGKLSPAAFEIPVYPDQARQCLNQIARQITAATGKEPSETELLQGFAQIANELMANAIRSISVQKGYKPQQYALVAFGGAAGQHACAVAELLQMSTIIISPHAGILSAAGIGQAAIERMAQLQILKPLDEIELQLPFIALQQKQQARKLLQYEITGDEPAVFVHCLFFLRLQGQDATIEISEAELPRLRSAFEQKYRLLYGYYPTGRTIEVESVKATASYKLLNISKVQNKKIKTVSPIPHSFQAVYENGTWQDTPVFTHTQLTPGADISGPALLLYRHSTFYLHPHWHLHIDKHGIGIARKTTPFVQKKTIGYRSKAVNLTLFTNRFKSIATEMGNLLQRTSLSVNIKERLDFSCALLDHEANLVVNAPHIPVHLGSLGICVRTLLQKLPMRPGDTVITNHPAYGGSHLPDITLVTPVYNAQNKLVGYVANRAHHAEIGGSRPGSMPPDAQNLAQEGVLIPPMYLIEQGVPNWNAITALLQDAPYPTRSLQDNLADLHAALAANRLGMRLLQQLAGSFGLRQVRHYMQQLSAYSAALIRNRLMQMPFGSCRATELLDDGTPLAVAISVTNRQAVIDFTGTGSTHAGNLNATPAIVHSAVLYVLRLLLNEDVPLNEGIMQPVLLKIPEGTILNPVFSNNPLHCPAVVGGNTETSQRLTDTLLKALNMAACSQGTMNNVIFGNPNFGYYETVCGGSGAGNGFHGTSAVHTHMTNTRITDPEILELRYPVRLEEFSVRQHSGGNGKYAGGNGVVRVLHFLQPVQVSVLSQHRVIPPYGLCGGENGLCGEQYIIKAAGTIVPLRGTDAYDAHAGDKLVLKTPGGGGFGAAG
ncbi:5-oxoprolinase [Sphingobacteriales bacterium UPWRP_1]|nr:hypothetical protein BVG80_16615 [Sphingobacteriales bacterium TSM_CSM]PSJ74374.1 5-oxoprolinase [Sphingobacteriales bacterium UPWRP_1]